MPTHYLKEDTLWAGINHRRASQKKQLLDKNPNYRLHQATMGRKLETFKEVGLSGVNGTMSMFASLSMPVLNFPTSGTGKKK